ncbi:MAG: dihydrolipoyl dehydrogenase [Planctomycetota bacterium]|nr:dihydrolipoyl dehydrogenase [Planctomycetota bacterium]MDA1137311.1 dihydrolipoyl dehydrogenase [Planctomycetota bacterium]
MATQKTRVAIVGAGPGGYPAAFLAAHHGMDVTLIDKEANPGGVCLYRGCIPSKALLHIAKLLNEAAHADALGIEFGKPKIDLEKLRAWKDSVIAKLTGGLGMMRNLHKVKQVQGTARFESSGRLIVAGESGPDQAVEFDYAIVATGSRPVQIPALSIDSPKVMDSTTALELADIPKSLLVIGGGYIGLELGSVYQALGSKVTVVEMTPGILPGADRDLADVLHQQLAGRFENILLETRVLEMKAQRTGIKVRMAELDGELPARTFSKVLVSVGRRPNSENLGLENTEVEVNERGFIEVDQQRRTSDAHIFAIGDVAGEPMLAHKATHEARVAIETIADKASAFEPACIPAVVFTDPEVAWCGVTENEAFTKNMKIRVSSFPWAASGRAVTLGRTEGLTKLIIDPRTERLLGVGIIGPGAGDLIAEGALAIEMGALAADLKLTIHPHPTLSETIMEAAELFYGHSPHYRSKE